MQYIENNMDDLFRKAADNYPLKTDSKDWDKIAPALITAPFLNTKKYNKKIKYSFLFVLSILSIAFLFLISIPSKHKRLPDFASTIPSNVLKQLKDIKPAIENNASNKTIAKSAFIPSSLFPGEKENLINRTLHDPTQKSNSSLKESRKKNNDSMLSGLFAEKIIDRIIPEQKSAIKESLVTTDQVLDYQTTINETERLITPVVPTTKKTIPLIAVNNSIIREQSSLIPNTGNKKTRRPRFYGGIATGLQTSQIKGQGFNKPGWSIGLIGGLRFNKKLSIESGGFYSNKNYYSKGKYFDMKKAGGSMPANMELISLTGAWNIFEVPIKLKYDFAQKNKSNWFFTAGISSSLIINEKNNYVALINNSSQNFTASYGNNKFSLASAATVSIGTELVIGNKLNIRIEPYLSIPLKGIGIGSLQTMTTGIHIGILKDSKHRH